jgi:hypothetical protein
VEALAFRRASAAASSVAFRFALASARSLKD